MLPNKKQDNNSNKKKKPKKPKKIRLVNNQMPYTGQRKHYAEFLCIKPLYVFLCQVITQHLGLHVTSSIPTHTHILMTHTFPTSPHVTLYVCIALFCTSWWSNRMNFNESTLIKIETFFYI